MAEIDINEYRKQQESGKEVNIRLPQYKIRVKANQEPPEDWTRVLVPFAGTSGLKILQMFTKEVIVESGSMTIGRIEATFGDIFDIFPYHGEHTQKDDVESEDKPWWIK